MKNFFQLIQIGEIEDWHMKGNEAVFTFEDCRIYVADLDEGLRVKMKEMLETAFYSYPTFRIGLITSVTLQSHNWCNVQEAFMHHLNGVIVTLDMEQHLHIQPIQKVHFTFEHQQYSFIMNPMHLM